MIVQSLFQADFISILKHCSVKIMEQNWGYESRFDVITSNQPHWNYHSGFVCVVWLVKYFISWGDRKKLLACSLLVGISVQADTMTMYVLCIWCIKPHKSVQSAWKNIAQITFQRRIVRFGEVTWLKSTLTNWLFKPDPSILLIGVTLSFWDLPVPKKA